MTNMNELSEIAKEQIGLLALVKVSLLKNLFKDINRIKFIEISIAK